MWFLQGNLCNQMGSTPPLVPRLPMILKKYVKVQTYKNLSHLLPQLANDPIWHHIAIAILTLPTTLTIGDAPHDAVPTHTATLREALAAMIIMTMIVTTNALLVHVMTANMLATMIFW